MMNVLLAQQLETNPQVKEMSTAHRTFKFDTNLITGLQFLIYTDSWATQRQFLSSRGYNIE